MEWRKSSYSGTQSDCVELAWRQGQLAVRDSKNPSGPVLMFPAPAVTNLTRCDRHQDCGPSTV